MPSFSSRGLTRPCPFRLLFILPVLFALAATARADLDLAGILTLEDNLPLTTSGAFEVGAAENVRAFIGEGNAFLPDGSIDPAARGILLSNATVGVVESGPDYAAVATGDALAIGIPGLSLTGSLTARINMLASPVAETIAVPGSPTLVSVSFTASETAGTEPFSLITGTGMALDINGQAITSDVRVHKLSVSRGGNTEGALLFSLVGAATNFAKGMTDLVTLTGASGPLLALSDGVAGTLAGNFSAAGISTFENLPFQINTTNTPIDETLVIDGQTVTITLPSGNYLQFIGLNTQLSVLGQTLSGSFLLRQDVSDDVTIQAVEIFTTLGDGPTDLLTMFGGAGLLLLTPDGVAGQLDGPNVTNVPGLALAGALILEINTTNLAVARTVTIDGSPVGVNLPPGPYVRMSGNNLLLVLDDQNFAGDFFFEQTGSGVLGRASGVISIFGSPGLINVGDAAGLLLLKAGGVAANLSGGAVTPDPDTSISGPLTFQINTTGGLVSENVTAGGETFFFDLAASPTVSLVGQDLQIGLLDFTLFGNVQFQKNISGQVIGQVSDATLPLSDGITNLLSLANGSGFFFLRAPEETFMEMTGQIASGVPGTLLDGDFQATGNTGPSAVNETLSVGGNPVVLDLPAGPFTELLGENATLIANGTSLAGNFLLEETPGGKVAALISQGSTSLGEGLATLSDLSGPLLFFDDGVAADAVGNTALNVPGIALTDSFQYQLNTTPRNLDLSVVVNAESFAISLPPDLLRLLNAGAVIQLVDLDLSGAFVIAESAPGVLKLQAFDTSFSMGPGVLDAAAVSGSLELTDEGAAGALSIGALAPNLPQVGLAGFTDRIEFNTRPAPVTGDFDFGGGLTTLILPAGPYAGVPFPNAVVSLSRLQLDGSAALFSGDVLIDSFEDQARLRIFNANAAVAPGRTNLVPGSGFLELRESNLITRLDDLALDFGTSLETPLLVTGGTFTAALPFRIHPASLKSGEVPLIDFTGATSALMPVDFPVSPPLPGGFSLTVATSNSNSPAPSNPTVMAMVSAMPGRTDMALTPPASPPPTMMTGIATPPSSNSPWGSIRPSRTARSSPPRFPKSTVKSSSPSPTPEIPRPLACWGSSPNGPPTSAPAMSGPPTTSPGNPAAPPGSPSDP